MATHTTNYNLAKPGYSETAAVEVINDDMDTIDSTMKSISDVASTVAGRFSTGVLKVANGGTGQTSLQATRNAMGLGNTTGALPAANGGTGQTSLQATRNAMGLGNTTGALPAANGGTGQTSLQATRNAMGLGNTTGALPVANGGTGATSASAAITNLGAQPKLKVGNCTFTYKTNGVGWFNKKVICSGDTNNLIVGAPTEVSDGYYGNYCVWRITDSGISKVKISGTYQCIYYD